MLPLALIPWLAGSTGVLGAAAAAYLFKKDDKTLPAVIPGVAPVEVPRWGRFDDFSLLLASAVFLIDGKLSDEEARYLEELRRRSPEESWRKVATALEEPNLFAVLGRWYRALDQEEKEQAETLLSELVRVDNQVAEEEVAFLVQFSQIVDGNEPLVLYVSRPMQGGSPDHGLFKYIAKPEFLADFPRSECVYREGEVYIEHPFLDQALERFSADDFQVAQEAMYEGLIGLMKDLGAKKIVLSDYVEEKGASGSHVGGGVNVAAGAGPAKIGVGGKAGYDVSADDLMREKQDLVVTFEGSKPRIIDRVLQRRWHARLMKKYAANKQYRVIIDGRFGDNRIKTFSHQMKSVDARKLAKAINAAAKLDKKMVKVGVDLKVKSSNSSVYTVEKLIKIDFH
jgi:hypothetical protein